MSSIDLGLLVRGVDSILRQQHGIRDFTEDENCIFRLSLLTMSRNLALADGTLITAGDLVAELHLWNEHLPSMPDQGPNAAWAVRLKRQIYQSLALVACHLENDSQFANVLAVTGAPAFSSRIGSDQMARTATRFGFEAHISDGNFESSSRFFMLFDSILLWALCWTFNRPGLRGKTLLRHRSRLWISRTSLCARYRSLLSQNNLLH